MSNQYRFAILLAHSAVASDCTNHLKVPEFADTRQHDAADSHRTNTFDCSTWFSPPNFRTEKFVGPLTRPLVWSTRGRCSKWYFIRIQLSMCK